jgi:hypothetical protein
MLLRNILAVHTARLLVEPDASFGESCLLALTHSFPQRALGIEVSQIKVLKCHREAWHAAALDEDDPRRLLMKEPDPLRRALRAARITSLSSPEFSGIVADCLAGLRPGGRHALATALFESGAAGNLVAAVAEQCGQLYGLAVTPQTLHETVMVSSPRHRLWRYVVATLARMSPDDPETTFVSNLLVGSFVAGEFSVEADIDQTLESWQQARNQVKELAA